MEGKPYLSLSLRGPSGNVSAVISTIAETLRQAGQREQAVEFRNKALTTATYDDVIALAREYVELNTD